MKNLTMLFGIVLFSSFAAADVYTCSGNSYSVQIERSVERVYLPTDPVRESSITTMSIVGEQVLANPIFAQVSQGRINFVSTPVYRTALYDFNVSGGGRFLSQSADGRFEAYAVGGNENLGDSEIEDLYSVDLVGGTIFYVVDGITTIDCQLQ